MSISNIFGVKTVSIKTLFAGEQESCFYIPAYQRPYSWKEDAINRMWEDIVYGFEQLGNGEDYITFLGSIITTQDTKYESIDLIAREGMPTKAMVIIDGQQRLTTLLLLVLTLDNATRKKLTKDNEESLFSSALEILVTVEGTYKSLKKHGDRVDISTDYPKIIRAYDDQWGTNDKQGKYNSPIARVLKQYITFMDNKENERKDFNYDTKGVAKNKKSHDEIRKNIKVFRKSITDFLKDKPEINKIIIQESALLDVKKSILCGSDGNSGISQEISDNSDKREIFILSLILRYVLQRVCVVNIVAKKEEYAFEMFDSLNTTGDPLTAFETFKPIVVKNVGLEKYFDSASYKSMKQTEDYLTQKPIKRDSVTKQLIVAFALSENGKKLSNKLREQRMYLQDKYTNSKDKEAFVKYLSTVSQFCNIWNSSNQDLGKILIDNLNGDMVALTCLQFLAKTNHTIAISLLSRFYEKSILDNSSDDFVSAIKAVAAFFTLWMSARAGTQGIDSCYRKLMSEGIDESKVRGGDGKKEPLNTISPFKREEGGDINLISLQRALRYFLLKGASDNVEIYSKDTWLSRIENIELYNNNKEVCKLMLIVASNDVVSDNSDIGLVQHARKGISETLNEGFNYSFFESIEHISPQKNRWKDVSNERKHTLGNLTLLPSKINSSVSNRSLKEKETMFRALSAKTKADQDKLLKESKVQFGNITKEILAQSQHFPYLESLSKLEGWNDEIIGNRTRNLGSIIWDKLAVEWLGFDKID